MQICSYLIKLITFTCTDLPPLGACEATKDKKDVVSNWSHVNLRRHIVDFHLSNTVMSVDIFVIIIVAATAVVAPVAAAVGKNVQQ